MSDLPLLSSEAIDDFLLKCNEIEGDYYYSILTKEDSQKNYPEFSHTYLKLKDGIFCGGGLTFLNPLICDPYRSQLMNKITRVRKNPLEMARILGPKILLKVALGQASRKDIEETASAVFKCKARAIITEYEEVGVNIDKPGELEIARSIISSKYKIGR